MKSLNIPGGVSLACAGLVTMASLGVACSSTTTDPPADGGGQPGAGSVQFTISGEAEALEGFAFPPASPDEPALVDGWEISYDRILLTIDKLTLSEDPDKSPTDQSVTGAVVAGLEGPWAVDLHAGGPLQGKGGPAEKAVALGTVTNQNKQGGKAFDASQRYAFGYDIVAATAGAQRVNLDATALADYTEMVDKKIAVLYVGTATWKGGASCQQSAPYDFTKLPTTVKFRLGLKTPTTYLNCQNPDLTGKPLDGEEKQRGIALKQNDVNVAQITIHTDHVFWNTVDHEAAEPFFDQLAAQATTSGQGPAMLTLDALEGVDFTTFKDKAGADLPWRSCIAAKAPPAGTRKFDPANVAVGPGKPAEEALRHYADFVGYVQSTQGHLNADGLCAVKRNYPSPR